MKTTTTKLFNAAENRQPSGSGRNSGQFAPGKVTPGSQNSNASNPSGSGSSSSGGGGGGGSGSSSGSSGSGSAGGPRSTVPGGNTHSVSPEQQAIDQHAEAMAQMDLQQARAIAQNIQNLESTLKELRQEIKFWSQPLSSTSSTSGSSSTSTSTTVSSQLAGSTATASGSSGSQTSSGGAPSSPGTTQASNTAPTFQAFLQNLKDQAKAVDEKIQSLRAEETALHERANQWLAEVKAAPEPDTTKADSGEIVMTAGQLRALLDSLTSAEFR